MARKEPSTTGGKLLALDILDILKANVDDMKANGGGRDAAENEKIGSEDMANAIAAAIEKVMGAMIMIPGPATTTPLITPLGGPVTGAIDLSLANIKYTFK